jgi:uncharacterized protein with ParB-like and HNH nuclease domain
VRPSSFRPESTFLGDLLTEKKPIRVPPYQRDYSWRAEQVTDFWDDLVHFERECSRNCDSPEYFLGTIVIVNTDKYREILDGQQRLATATILLAAIRNRARELGSDLAECIHNTYIARTNP